MCETSQYYKTNTYFPRVESLNAAKLVLQEIRFYYYCFDRTPLEDAPPQQIWGNSW